MHKSSLFDARRKWPAAVSGWGDAVYAPLAVDPEIKDSLIKMAWGLALFMVLLVSVLVLFGDEFKALGQAAVNRFGYAGVGIGIALIDMFTLPLPPDTILALAVAGGLDPVWTIVWGSAGSITGGIGAYWLGRLLGTTRFVVRVVAPFKERGEAFIDRLGVNAVIVAALTPIPFSIVCTLAGAMGMNFVRFLPATLFRIPRIAIYYLLIKWGFVLVDGA